MSPEKRAWRNLRSRCNNPNTPGYHRYGGRGIRNLYNSYEEFFGDVGPRPSPEYSLDRIDNNGHYQVGNCRWATKSQQAANTSANTILTYKGISKTLSEWAADIGVKSNTLLYRVRRGWPLSKALGSKTSKRQGPDHAKAKLNESDVLAIRCSDESHSALAKKYGVCRRAIWSIQKRETWRHV